MKYSRAASATNLRCAPPSLLQVVFRGTRWLRSIASLISSACPCDCAPAQTVWTMQSLSLYFANSSRPLRLNSRQLVNRKQLYLDRYDAGEFVELRGFISGNSLVEMDLHRLHLELIHM